jgi:hypothetical protein
VDTISKTSEMKNDFNLLNRMFPKAQIRSHKSDSLELNSIGSLIPDDKTCMELLNVYCIYFEKVYHILHLPTLSRQYLQFRDNTINDLDRKRFIPQLALIVAICSGLWDDGYVPPEVLSIDPWTTCCIVEQWLSGLTNKERISLPNLQTYTLLILAKQIVPMSPTEVWHSTGELVRLAMMGGLHRDPDELSGTRGAVPADQAKSRRLLWYTIMEQDIEASIGCCMPSLVGTIDYTCQICVPERIDDDRFIDESERRGYEGFEGFKQHLPQSLPLRTRAVDLLTRTNPNIDEIDEVLIQLEAARSNILSNTALHQSTGADVIFTTTLLDMCFRRPMISLYTLQLQRLEENKDLRLEETARAFISASVAVMAHSDMLDPRLTDHESMEERKYWTLFQAYHGDDLVRAAGGACFALNILSSSSLNTAGRSEIRRSEHHSTIWPRNAVRRMVEQVIQTMIRLTPDLRSNLKQIMGLALAAELTRVHLDPESKEKQMRNALQRVFKLCRERFEAENGNVPVESDLPEQLETLPTPDLENLEDLLNSQLLDIDPFGFDWGADPLPNFNF